MEFYQNRILITPLNWGLGHATRCVPLIRKFLKQQNEIAIASDGEALTYLKNEFPGLSFFELPSYKISYPSQSALLNMSLMAPRILKAIHFERKKIQEIAKIWRPDLLISDSRFGCYLPKVKSVIIAHQIQIISKFLPAQKIARTINHYWINRFDECWIPDYNSTKSLAGELSNNKGLKKSRYIGPISRFQKVDLPKLWDVLVILSGPEPSRTRLETILINELNHFTQKKILFIRGTNKMRKLPDHSQSIEFVDVMQSDLLNKTIAKSSFVICRSGYSSIMDLHKLKADALLIPTPGQTEQEYLANYLESNQFSISTQDAESIRRQLQKTLGLVK
jgi:uncharacterized protein (TIGR00661 family)